MAGEVRIDSFLWAVRIFKSRSLASDACKKGRVTINSQSVKPSRLVVAGDVIGGRPTKKDRRSLDEWQGMNDNFFIDNEDFFSDDFDLDSE